MTCFRECFGFIAGAKDDRYAVLSFKNMSSFWRTGAEFMAIRELRGLFAASLFAVAVVTGGPAAADPAGPGELAVGPSEPITVKVLTVNGSGCPDGTATVTPLAGNTGFSIAYSDYVASVSGSATPTDFRKNCQISLLIQVPQGFSYAIAKADYSGTARLAEGATGLERANTTSRGRRPIPGPTTSSPVRCTAVGRSVTPPPSFSTRRAERPGFSTSTTNCELTTELLRPPVRCG